MYFWRAFDFFYTNQSPYREIFLLLLDKYLIQYIIFINLVIKMGYFTLQFENTELEKLY